MAGSRNFLVYGRVSDAKMDITFTEMLRAFRETHLKFMHVLIGLIYAKPWHKFTRKRRTFHLVFLLLLLAFFNVLVFITINSCKSSGRDDCEEEGQLIAYSLLVNLFVIPLSLLYRGVLTCYCCKSRAVRKTSRWFLYLPIATVWVLVIGGLYGVLANTTDDYDTTAYLLQFFASWVWESFLSILVEFGIWWIRVRPRMLRSEHPLQVYIEKEREKFFRPDYRLGEFHKSSKKSKDVEMVLNVSKTPQNDPDDDTPNELERGSAEAKFFEHCFRNKKIDIKKAIAHNPNIVNLRNNRGETGLHVAAHFGHLDILQSLIQAGAHLNGCNVDQETPLLVALKREHWAAAVVLIRAGADVRVRDASGASVWELATSEEVKNVLTNEIARAKSDVRAEDIP